MHLQPEFVLHPSFSKAIILQIHLLTKKFATKLRFYTNQNTLISFSFESFFKAIGIFELFAFRNVSSHGTGSCPSDDLTDSAETLHFSDSSHEVQLQNKH